MDTREIGEKMKTFYSHADGLVGWGKQSLVLLVWRKSN